MEWELEETLLIKPPFHCIMLPLLEVFGNEELSML